jgi:hypothetical protein
MAAGGCIQVSLSQLYNISQFDANKSQYGYTAGRNPFVEAALCLTLAYAEHAVVGSETWRKRLSSDSMEITMLADNDFYSQRNQAS